MAWLARRELLARQESSLLGGISRNFRNIRCSVANYKFENHGGRSKILTLFLASLIRLVGKTARMVEGIFFDKGGPYQQRTHGRSGLSGS